MSDKVPFYRDEYCSIYQGDCRQILPQLIEVTAIVSDPPYGISYKSGHNTGYRMKGKGPGQFRRDKNFPPIFGDDEPFDPEHLLDFPRVVLFGANHFSSRLPDSKSWIVWDKREGQTPDNQADIEMAWTNLQKPARLFGHYWRGLLRKGDENNTHKLHPNQKPLMLMRWILQHYTEPGDIICDPYMGSGSTLRAAKDLGRHCIGIEYEESYCRIAVERLRQEPLPFNR